MEVHLSSDLEAKLSRMAADQGRPAGALVEEAVERYVDYDRWFAAEVDQGLAGADQGDLVDHDQVKRLIRSRYPG